MSSLKYWVWLSSIGGFGSVAALQLLRSFGAPEDVYRAQVAGYRDVEGITSAVIDQLSNKSIEPANKILSACLERGYRIITLQDAEYPDRLRNIYNPPIVMYVRGNLPAIDEEPVVSIVGTRTCTPYGISAAENIGFRLAQRGVVVATGLAKGIDSAAARGALRGGGRVIGIIGSGLDVIYPPGNKTLFDDVAGAGAVLSEYPPGTPAAAFHFPARNRLLSGISLGVAVIEAPKRSGALITAARALEQGRDVFALPGNVDAISCEGSNALLREGAMLILSAEDIISEYEGLYPDKIRPASAPVTNDTEHTRQSGINQRDNTFDAGVNEKKEIDNLPAVEYIDVEKILDMLTGDEKTVAKTIGSSALHTDEIIVRTELPAQQVLTALTMLEIKGCAVHTGGKFYKLVNPNP